MELGTNGIFVTKLTNVGISLGTMTSNTSELNNELNVNSIVDTRLANNVTSGNSKNQ